MITAIVAWAALVISIVTASTVVFHHRVLSMLISGLKEVAEDALAWAKSAAGQ